MSGYYGTTGMWYRDGTFYEVDTTHVDFFLNNYEKLGFSQKEKEDLCVQMGLKADATHCEETSETRVDIMLEVIKRGNIRIRFYSGKTSVQCYDFKNSRDAKELKNCIMDGLGKCFSNIITVMDCQGWGEIITNYDFGIPIKEFLASSTHKPNFVYILYKDIKFSGENMKTIKSNTGRVLEGEEKDAVLREALKQQGYSDSDIATMLGQSGKTWGKESDYEDMGESDEEAVGEVQDSYNESKDAYQFNSKAAPKGKKPIKSVRIVQDMSFRDFEPWSGAKSTYDVIIGEGKEDEMDAMLDEMYPDGLTDTELNDLLWFDADSVFEWLGIESGEDGLPEGYDYDEDEQSSYPRAHKRPSEGLPQSRKVSAKKEVVFGKKAIKSSEGGRVLEGEEKNAVLREALKQQGYSDSDIALMLSQSRKTVAKKEVVSAKKKPH